jgi:hypothetical protein
MAASAIPASLLLARTRPDRECLPTEFLDIPRGGITELSGPPSSGKTSLMHSVLAAATARGEVCALADASNRLDPASAERSGVVLANLLWANCGGDPAAALKVADLLAHGGGFGVVALDLTDVPARVMNRLPAVWWYRFRRAIENTPTILLVIGARPLAGSCALRSIECRLGRARWSGAGPGRLLEGIDARIVPRRPAGPAVEIFAGAR